MTLKEFNLLMLAKGYRASEVWEKLYGRKHDRFTAELKSVSGCTITVQGPSLEAIVGELSDKEPANA